MLKLLPTSTRGISHDRTCENGPSEACCYRQIPAGATGERARGVVVQQGLRGEEGAQLQAAEGGRLRPASDTRTLRSPQAAKPPRLGSCPPGLHSDSQRS